MDVIRRTDLERLAPLWRTATTYPCLVDETLAGNPEALGPHQLHTRAWASSSRCSSRPYARWPRGTTSWPAPA